MTRQVSDITLKFSPNDYPLEPGLRLLEASAGTGKTFALAHLVLRLLTEGKHSINEILVVTFTEAAAAELKARISARIHAALIGLESSEEVIETNEFDEVLKDWIQTKVKGDRSRLHWASLLLEALENIDLADITTIHGFCNRTLRREAIDSNASISPILEEDNSELVFEVIHDYWQHQFLKLKPKDIKGLTDAGVTIEKLYGSLLKIDNDPSLVFQVNLSDVQISKPLANQFNHWVNTNWLDFISAWEQEGNDLEARLRSQAEHWRSQGIKDTKPFSPKPTKNRYEILDNWISINSQRFINSDGVEELSYDEIRKQILLGNYFHPSVICEVAEHVGDKNNTLTKSKLQRAIAELWDSPAEKVWLHALGWASSELADRRKRNGVISYGGLLKALDPDSLPSEQKENLHSNGRSLLTKLQSKYRVALIDEFQDTDSIQWRLLHKAFGCSPTHLLLMVGDPKQAIYKFRGGDLNVYKKARNKVDQIHDLLENYRTTPPLMEGLNRLMSPGLKYSNLKVASLTPCAHKQELLFSNDQNPLQVLVVDQDTSGKAEDSKVLLSKSNLEEIIPTAITNEILEILANQTKQLQPSDICILVNRHDQADKVSSALAIAGLPSRLVTQGDVLASHAAQVLQRFLDCLASPGNSSKLRLVACSSLMQWNIERLKTADNNGELDDLAKRFKYWTKNLPKLGLLGCLSDLLEAHVIADLSERGRILIDLQQCAQLVQEAIHNQGLDATSAARWLRQQRLRPAGQVAKKREPQSDVEESAINVVTIHRSKGLEYRVVICPYLWQAPPISSGPLWRFEGSNKWLIALNRKWGKGKNLAIEAQQASLQEAERLTYVALTRAKDHLIIIWANGAKQEGNPLTCFLFGPKALGCRQEELTTERLRSWITNNNIKATIKSAKTDGMSGNWHPPRAIGELGLGPVPKEQPIIRWGRNSYSSLVNTKSYSDPIDLSLKEQGKDIDQQTTSSVLSSDSLTKSPYVERLWSDQGPLGNFPRGAAAGDCLHRILEKINFRAPLHDQSNATHIDEELLRSGFDINLRKQVDEGLTRVLNTPLGGPLGNFKLNELTENRRVHELSFDLPIAQNGNQVGSLDIANAFLKDPKARFGSTYATSLAALDFSSRGFLTGSIDLIFADKKDLSEARWWLTDWKSNWIGESDNKNGIETCGPIHYDEKSMEKVMLHHHYPLQAHIYLVALHRFLEWRLPNYNPNKHIGGYIYVFLRGLPGEKALSKVSQRNNTPGLIIEKASIKRIVELDLLLQKGGKAKK